MPRLSSDGAIEEPLFGDRKERRCERRRCLCALGGLNANEANRRAKGIRRTRRLPLLRTCQLPDRHGYTDRRRSVSGAVLVLAFFASLFGLCAKCFSQRTQRLAKNAKETLNESRNR